MNKLERWRVKKSQKPQQQTQRKEEGQNQLHKVRLCLSYIVLARAKEDAYKRKKNLIEDKRERKLKMIS